MASGLQPTEAQLQDAIVQLLALYRWRSYHTYDSRRSTGGYPDLTLVRDRVIFAELKRAGEDPRPDQVAWLDDLAAGGAEVYLWRTDDLQEVAQILDRKGRDFTPFGLIGPGIPGSHWRPSSLWIAGHGRSDGA